MPDLNLSTRPFPPYRLINLALGCVCAFLVVVSLWQAYGFVQFSSMAGRIRRDEQEARIEAESLRMREGEFATRLDRPEATAKLNEIGFLNGLIARKSLSWTRLFANLEDMVPDAVHLVSLTPEIKPGGPIALRIEVVGRSIADVSRFIDALEKSPEFEKVAVSVEQKSVEVASTDVNVFLTTNYFPERETR